MKKVRKKRETQQIKKSLQSKKRKIQEEKEILSKRRNFNYSTFDTNFDQLFLESRNIDVPIIPLSTLDKDFIETLSNIKNLNELMEIPSPNYDKSFIHPNNVQFEKPKEKKPKERKSEKGKNQTESRGQSPVEKSKSPTTPTTPPQQTGVIPKEKSISKYKRSSRHVQISYFIYNSFRKDKKRSNT